MSGKGYTGSIPSAGAAVIKPPLQGRGAAAGRGKQTEEDNEMLNLLSYAMGKQAGAAGGVQNTIETLDGTLAAPFGTYEIGEVLPLLAALQATAYLSVTVSGQYAFFPLFVPGANGTVIYGAGAIIEVVDEAPDVVSAMDLRWTASGLNRAYVMINGDMVDLLPAAEEIETECVLVRHPID